MRIYLNQENDEVMIENGSVLCVNKRSEMVCEIKYHIPKKLHFYIDICNYDDGIHKKHVCRIERVMTRQKIVEITLTYS